MGDKQKQRSLVEIMNDVLDTVRQSYDAQYVYYIERNQDEILTIYEWCAPDVPWQRDRIKMLEPNQFPKWLKSEVLDTNESDYSVFQELGDDEVAILAAVGVRRGGCDMYLLQAMLPNLTQTVSMHKTMMQQEYLSYHDSLTGLLNRNSFTDYMEEAEEKKFTSLGVLSVDINGLKNFNREFGREYGDEVVTRVGEVLEEHFRGEMVFRLAGDEFLAIVEDTSYESFLKHANQVYETLDCISLGLISMGYAWEKVDADVSALVTEAENMMREEKQKYYKNLKKGHHEPIIKQDLLDDLQEGRYIVCLIPKVDVMTEEVVGAEAVVRYHHKDLGIMDPSKYMTILADTKLSHHLDLYIFEEVCKTLRRWEQDGRMMFPISVNFQAASLCRENITKEMLRIVNAHRISCEYLEIEVSAASTSMSEGMLAEISNKIRKENIRVILDHFGVKNSSLTVLSMMEMDGLKLDKSLVTNIIGNDRSRIVAQAVIEMCHRFGVHVSASGVETQDQLNVLKELDCDYAQGTLFNKPITIDTFEVRYMND
jgi:diguanylate cyclase (GGDEF)-like protein